MDLTKVDPPFLNGPEEPEWHDCPECFGAGCDICDGYGGVYLTSEELESVKESNLDDIETLVMRAIVRR